jgi:1-acyl-sn-glycerol-3-phosphate acyltransferase
MSERRQRARQTMQRRVAARSPIMFRIFARIFERTLRKGFHAVRVANCPAASVLQSPQLVIFSNHPAWWDGVTFLYLADRLLAGRAVYTPIDSAMSTRYGFVGRVGAFGVEQHAPEGALHFLEACRIIFADVRNVLLVTAQGRFADCRERPLKLEPGIAHVVEIASQTSYLPLAIEYTHWLEKQPELLLRFGNLIAGSQLAGMRPSSRLAVLEQALTETMDALARDSIAREESAFETLISGRGGINPVYDLWRRGVAWLTGRAYSPEHGAPP